MKKYLYCLGLTITTTLFTGCDFIKQKFAKDNKQSVELSDWSCTSESNLNQIKNYLAQEFRDSIDIRLQQSTHYEADLNLLEQIKSSVKFNIVSIATQNDDPKESKKLDCQGQLIAYLPKGLQKRAENAYLEEPCEYCEEDGARTLASSVKDEYSNLTLHQDQIKGLFNYNIIQTDKDGITLQIPENIDVINLMVSVTRSAVQYESYRKINQEYNDILNESDKEHKAQKELATKAMDIRRNDLQSEQKKVVERMNQTWDVFTPEQKEQLKSDQESWFERRDVDCKVIAQKRIDKIKDNELETYQQHSKYWDAEMEKANEDMQYIKCFNQKTNERIIYLNNFFN